MRRRTVLVAAVVAVLLGACAGAPPASPPGVGAAAPPPGASSAERPVDTVTPSVEAPFTSLAARFTDRARKQERSGDLRGALDSWKVVAALRPQAAEPKRRVAELTPRLKAEAERHYREALVLLREGQANAARRELLLTLIADPDHAAALETIKNGIVPDASSYSVAAGDSFEAIAKKLYGDPDRAALVALINNLDPAGRPNPGTILLAPSFASLAAKPVAGPGPAPLPALTPTTAPDTVEPQDSGYDTEPAALGAEEPGAPSPGPASVAVEPAATSAPAPTPPLKAPDPAEAQLAKALALFQAAKFGEAAAAADKLVDNAALGGRARELSGNAWFAIGDKALKEERFTEAVAAYKRAERDRKDVPAALAAVERRKKEKAEELYNAGVQCFINQKLDDAIASWELTLELNPEHPKAPRDIEKARGLQQKLKDIR